MTLPERSSLSRSVWKGADDDVDVCAHFDRLRRVPFLLRFFSDSSFLLYRWSKDTMSDDVDFVGQRNNQRLIDVLSGNDDGDEVLSHILQRVLSVS